MEREKLLIVSATGLIGGYLYKVFSRHNYPVIGTYYSSKPDDSYYYVDITVKESLEEIISKEKPKILILNAALTNVDYCEQNRDEAWRINVKGLKNTVEICKAYKLRLVFLSTEYIFDGSNGPYSEEDIPNPICFYGETKLEGENIIKRELKDYLIIRTTVVYGKAYDNKNFAGRFIASLNKGEEVKVPCDQVGSPTYALNLSEIIEELVRNKYRGIYNVVGKDIMDRYSFSLAICSEWGLNKDLVIPVKTAELGQEATRPLKGGLRIDKVCSVIKKEILGVKKSLEILKKELS